MTDFASRTAERLAEREAEQKRAAEERLREIARTHYDDPDPGVALIDEINELCSHCDWTVADFDAHVGLYRKIDALKPIAAEEEARAEAARHAREELTTLIEQLEEIRAAVNEADHAKRVSAGLHETASKARRDIAGCRRAIERGPHWQQPGAEMTEGVDVSALS